MNFDKANQMVKATGGDIIRLGRWSWILFEGKFKHVTRIIPEYIPCKTSDIHRQTAYNQHNRYFYRQSITECPKNNA